MHVKRLWCWERLRTGGEGDNRGWDDWMASPTQWTWVWVDSGSWLWTGKPGMLWFIGLQRVGHDWATELNWCSLQWKCRVLTTGPSGKPHCQFIFNRLIFRGSLGSLQYQAEAQRSPIYSVPHTFIASPIISIPHQSSTFVRIDKPILMHHCNPVCSLYLGLLLILHTLHTHLSKFIMTCIYHYSIIQSSFTALKNQLNPTYLFPLSDSNLGDYSAFIDSMDVWRHTPNFILLLPYCVGSSGSFAFHVNFRISLSVSTK